MLAFRENIATLPSARMCVEKNSWRLTKRKGREEKTREKVEKLMKNNIGGILLYINILQIYILVQKLGITIDFHILIVNNFHYYKSNSSLL